MPTASEAYFSPKAYFFKSFSLFNSMAESEGVVTFIRLLISAVAAGALYYVWTNTRVGLDEWYVPIGASLFFFVFVYFILQRMKD